MTSRGPTLSLVSRGKIRSYKLNMERLQGKTGRFECDSHADTTAAGSNMVMVEDIADVHDYVDVAQFSETYEPIRPLITAPLAVWRYMHATVWQ